MHSGILKPLNNVDTFLCSQAMKTIWLFIRNSRKKDSIM